VKRLAAFLILLFCLVAFGGRSLADSGDAGGSPTQRETLEPKNTGSEFLNVASGIPEYNYVSARTGSFDSAFDAPTCAGVISCAPPVGRVSCKRCVYDAPSFLCETCTAIATKVYALFLEQLHSRDACAYGGRKQQGNRRRSCWQQGARY
jgi:hypothetical protein